MNWLRWLQCCAGRHEMVANETKNGFGFVQCRWCLLCTERYYTTKGFEALAFVATAAGAAMLQFGKAVEGLAAAFGKTIVTVKENKS